MYILFFLLLLSLYESDDAKGIPEFWLTAMKNVDMLADMIQVWVVLVVQPFYLQGCIVKQIVDENIKSHQLMSIVFH